MGAKPGLPGSRWPLSPSCSGPTMLSMQTAHAGPKVTPARGRGQLSKDKNPPRAEASPSPRRSQSVLSQPYPKAQLWDPCLPHGTGDAACRAGGHSPVAPHPPVGTRQPFQASCPNKLDTGRRRWWVAPSPPSQQRSGQEAGPACEAHGQPCLSPNTRSLSRSTVTQHPINSRYKEREHQRWHQGHHGTWHLTRNGCQGERDTPVPGRDSSDRGRGFSRCFSATHSRSCLAHTHS